MQNEDEDNLIKESILLDKYKNFKFVQTRIEEALGKKVKAKLLLRGTRDGISSKVFH